MQRGISTTDAILELMMEDMRQSARLAQPDALGVRETS